MIRRAELTDFLVVDGESLVIRDETVYRLGHVATAIVALAAEETSVEALAAALEPRFGAPPEGTLEDAVEAQVSELRAAGLLA